MLAQKLSTKAFYMDVSSYKKKKKKEEKKEIGMKLVPKSYYDSILASSAEDQGSLQGQIFNSQLLNNCDETQNKWASQT